VRERTRCWNGRQELAQPLFRYTNELARLARWLVAPERVKAIWAVTDAKNRLSEVVERLEPGSADDHAAGQARCRADFGEE